LDWWIEEYMIFCRSRQLRGKTLDSYEQGLRLFERWCKDTLNIDTVDKISEGVIRRYINEIHERGKYTFYARESDSI
jgi:integrase/recombinase XerD